MAEHCELDSVQTKKKTKMLKQLFFSLYTNDKFMFNIEIRYVLNVRKL